MNEWNFTVERQLNKETALRIAYVGSFGYHGLISIDPNSYSRAGVRQRPKVVWQAGMASVPSKVAQGASYIPVGARPNPFLSGGFFWYTEGNSSYNALQTDVTRRLSSRSGISSELHVVEESRHQFRSDRRASAATKRKWF